MLEHIVLWKLKEGVTDEQIENCYRALEKLKKKIPGIVEFRRVMNNSPEEKSHGFEQGFVVIFEDEKARDNYLPHVEHQRVVKEYIRPIVDDVLVFDYDL